jgi:hypothetical protein
MYLEFRGIEETRSGKPPQVSDILDLIHELFCEIIVMLLQSNLATKYDMLHIRHTALVWWSISSKCKNLIFWTNLNLKTLDAFGKNSGIYDTGLRETVVLVRMYFWTGSREGKRK